MMAMGEKPHTTNVGLLVGRYLQTLAALSLASMIVSTLLGRFYFDVSFILLFWAGAALVKRNPVVRVLLLPLFGMTCLVGLFMTVHVLIRGTTGVTLDVGPFRLENPPVGTAVCASLAIAVVSAFPLYALLTKEAVSQFANSDSNAVNGSDG